MEFAGEPRDVADPWYTRNFKKAYDDISFGSNALLEKLINWKE
jgi:protein-tyrosine phosphatase